MKIFRKKNLEDKQLCPLCGRIVTYSYSLMGHGNYMECKCGWRRDIGGPQIGHVNVIHRQKGIMSDEEIKKVIEKQKIVL